MTRAKIFTTIFGILGAAALTFSLGACTSRSDSMKKSEDTSMSKAMDDTSKKDGMSDSSMSGSNTTMSGSSTMTGSSTMSK